VSIWNGLLTASFARKPFRQYIYAEHFLYIVKFITLIPLLRVFLFWNFWDCMSSKTLYMKVCKRHLRSSGIWVKKFRLSKKIYLNTILGVSFFYNFLWCYKIHYYLTGLCCLQKKEKHLRIVPVSWLPLTLLQNNELRNGL